MAVYVSQTDGLDSRTFAQAQDPATPWKTLTKVRDYANSPGFPAGTSIFLKCGDIWREQFRLYTNSGANLVIGAYGVGVKPRIYGSRSVSLPANWADQGGNLWRAGAAYGAAPVVLDTEVGSLLYNVGLNPAPAVRKSTGGASLVAQGDYYYDGAGAYVEVYSVGNPANVYTGGIEACLRWAATNGGTFVWGGGQHDITVQDLDIRYSGWHAISIGPSCYNLVFERIDVDWAGGGYLTWPTGSTRDGNCILFSRNQTNVTVRYCNLWHANVMGVSYQGYAPGDAVLDGFWVYRNIIGECVSGAEVYTDSGVAFAASNVWIAHNLFYNIGIGAFANVRTVTSSRSFRMGSASRDVSQTNVNCNVVNNIFHGALIDFISTNANQDWDGWRYAKNLYFNPTTAQPFRWLDGNTKTFAQWKLMTGTPDVDSLFGQDPLFVDLAGRDFRLRYGSPCVDAALVVAGVGQEGVTKGLGPDIGPFERAEVLEMAALVSDSVDMEAVLTPIRSLAGVVEGEDGTLGGDLTPARVLAGSVAGEDLEMGGSFYNSTRFWTTKPRHVTHCPRCGAKMVDSLMTLCPQCRFPLGGRHGGGFLD